MGIRSRLKELLEAAQGQSGTNSFSVRSSEAPPMDARGTASPPPTERPASRPAPAPAPSMPSPPPMGDPPDTRKVIQAPIVAQPVQADTSAGEGIRIKAQPQRDGKMCLFMVNQPVLPERSWYFDDAKNAAGSVLAQALFALDDVDTVIVDDSTVTVTLDQESGDWNNRATAIGGAIRDVLESGKSAVDAALIAEVPPEGDIRAGIQQCIDDEVNPGVAAHSGYITLTRVRGNSVYIQMGGGCQGCSAADLTLKQGIHQAFRTAVPHVGAIYDETDHAAGLNPYFS